jgi:hypothetical protein
MCVAVMILCIGSALMWNSNDVGNLMENAVSLTTVLEVDQHLYAYMLTPRIKRWFASSIPPIPVLRGYNDERPPLELQNYLGRHHIDGEPGQQLWIFHRFMREAAFGEAFDGRVRLLGGSLWIALTWAHCCVYPSYSQLSDALPVFMLVSVCGLVCFCDVLFESAQRGRG